MIYTCNINTYISLSVLLPTCIIILNFGAVGRGSGKAAGIPRSSGGAFYKSYVYVCVFIYTYIYIYT